jgi:hypothetical protein
MVNRKIGELEKMTHFGGLVPAAITPMTAAGKIHEEGFRRVLDFNLSAGAHGFWVAGGTGESVLLEDEENRQLAGIAAEQVSGRGVVIMHVGAATTVRAAALAEHAANVGVTAICCIRDNTDELVARPSRRWRGHTEQRVLRSQSVCTAAIKRIGRPAKKPLFVLSRKKVQSFFDHAKTDGVPAQRALRESSAPQHPLGAESLVHGFYVGMHIRMWPVLRGNPVDPGGFDIQIGMSRRR